MCMAFPFSKPYFNRKKQGLKHAFGRVAVARESSVCPPPPRGNPPHDAEEQGRYAETQPAAE